MSVHYRFKSALEYDTITFDGLHISVKDLKNAIAQQKRIGKSTDFDLQVTNAQTKEVYDDENALIPKNTSLLIARVPVAVPKPKQWEGYGGNDTPPQKLDDGGPIAKAVDLSSLDAPEDDKIKAMMSQSTQEYDPSNYLKIRGANQVGPVPVNYRCYKCHQGGHWIKDCPITQGTETSEIKKSTGIPRSFMVPVEGPQVPGAMITPNGQYAVPVLDHEAYNQKNPAPAPVPEPKPEIPEDLVCSVCSDLLTDAVMIPCCGNSFCDECIRGVLLESEDHECPDCHEKDISPGTLIPNRFLRKSVANFKNTTGYEKKHREKEQKPEQEKKDTTPPPQADSTEKEIAKSEEEKTVISEADSTEHAKSDGADFAKDADPEPGKSESESLPEGPPGVSPSRGSPKHQISSKITREHRDRDRDRSSRHHRHRGESPRKQRIHRRSPNYDSRRREERTGTPTRDEPRVKGGGYPPSSNAYSEASAPPMMGSMPPVQGHMPPGFPPGQVPPMGGFPQGPPPPNYRMPPPGTGAPPFMPPPGPFPPTTRPVFDPTRPPMSGPPPFNPAFSRSHRDYGRRGVRDRTPPGIIDDPLAAFNRILREKDERRAKQQRANTGGGGGFRRSSYSRSRSRSYSRSPPPKGRRRGSRSPRRRGSRSRSRSFSISRSRSRSWGRNSSPPPYRQSPPPSNRRQSPSRRGPPPSSRYRSPSPPPRRRGEREYRDNRGDRYKDRRDDRDDKHHFDSYDDRRNRGNQWRQQDNYYDQGYQNRYPPRDYGPPPVLQHQNMPVQPRFDIIGPPGVEQPPIPGLENESPKIDKFERQPASPRAQSKSEEREKECRNRSRSRSPDKLRPKEKESSKSPDKWRNPSPRSNSRSKDRTPPPDKHKRRRRDSSSDRETRRRDHSDDERKKKDKKRHKEKREKDKKKKKEKHRKTEKEKDKRTKEEFKQIIPKVEDTEDNTEIDYEEMKRIEAEERERLRLEEEAMEEKRLAEERKKEERRLRFLEDEKKRKLEEEKKRKIEEEKRKRLEEMLLKIEEDKPKVTQNTLYEEEGVMDPNTVENYGKLKEPSPKIGNSEVQPEEEEEMEEGELQDDDNLKEPEEEEEGGVLELLSNDLDLKTENDIFAPVPERSKWEMEGDEGPGILSPTDKEKVDSKTQKVTNEVLKRAENAIFAKAINAIRPIEVKKASGEKIKIHLGEVERKEPRIEVTVPVQIDPKKIDLTVEKPRLSVKDRLGIKIDDADRVVKVDRKPSRSISPFSRRDRRLDDTEYRRHDRKRRSRSRRRDMGKRNDRRPDARKDGRRRSAHRKEERERSKSKHKDEKKDKRRRSASKSGSEEKKKKKRDKKTKKEKEKKTEDDKQETAEERPKSATAKRKPTLDEANFEPDYDLELHDDDISGDEIKKTDTKEESEDSSASDSDSSSSEEERKKKRHKKQKRRKRRDSSSSSSESSSDSSDSDKEKKRRKHKKSKRKKKKSKHK